MKLNPRADAALAGLSAVAGTVLILTIRFAIRNAGSRDFPVEMLKFAEIVGPIVVLGLILAAFRSIRSRRERRARRQPKVFD